MATRMQQRRGTAAQWTSANPTLAAGEIGYETDTGKFKIGNGSSLWSALNYYVDANAILDGAPGVLDTLNELAAALGDDPSFITTVGTNLSNHTGATTNVHGIADTDDLATKNYVNNAVSSATVDQSALAGEGIDWNSGSETFNIDSTVVTLTGNQTLTNKSLTSPDLTGVPTAPTALGGTNTTQIATTQFVIGEISTLIDGAPGALNTLNELAAALADNNDFSGTVTNLIAEKVAKGGDTMTGALTLPGAPTQNLHAATKKYVDDAQAAAQGYADGLAVNYDAAGTANSAVSAHNSDETNVHGIADTSALATKTYADSAVSTHNGVTTNVHGIADTSALATKTYADSAVSTHNGVTTNVHGIADTSALATTSALSSHASDTTSVHGIADTADLVVTSDPRLTDTRTPTDNTVSTAKIVDSSVTADKLAGDSVTSAKIADDAVTTGKIANGTIVNADINASAAIDWTKLAISSTVSATELGYVDGVTSAIQTQLDAKYSSASATTDLALKANLASPALTGTPTAPTATAGTNTTQIATTAFVTGAVSDLIASAPGALNTLDELAAALGDDANFASTVTNSLAAKAPIASPTFTGTVTVAASGIAFTDGTQTKEGVPSRTAITSVTDTYNLSTGGLALRDGLIECNKATGFTLTIPANSTTAYPVGTSIDILQVGAGQVTIAGAAGVTVNATPGLKLRAQWSSATLFKRATDTWVVMGDLSA